MLETVNVGFIGCGGNARGHMKRVVEDPHARLVGVCDVVEELARKAADETGAEAYTDHRRLLDRRDLNAVYISIPVFAHGQPEFDTIERGLSGGIRYYGSIDLADARHRQTILAYGMNGKPLPVENGAPLRVRVERQLGYKMPKYLRKIELVDSFAMIGQGHGGYWEDNGYDWFGGI